MAHFTIGPQATLALLTFSKLNSGLLTYLFFIFVRISSLEKNKLIIIDTNIMRHFYFIFLKLLIESFQKTEEKDKHLNEKKMTKDNYNYKIHIKINEN